VKENHLCYVHVLLVVFVQDSYANHGRYCLNTWYDDG
jgi:hypothetical protein